MDRATLIRRQALSGYRMHSPSDMDMDMETYRIETEADLRYCARLLERWPSGLRRTLGKRV